MLVAPGTYSQVSERTILGQPWTAIVFLRADILVRSEQGLESTILDLQQLPGPRTVVVAAIDIPTGDSMSLEGFTITGASEVFVQVLDCGPSVTLVLRNCVIDGQESGYSGIYGQNTNVSLEQTASKTASTGP